jgi:hypothetical protein
MWHDVWMYVMTGKNVYVLTDGMLFDRTYGGAFTPATSTMNSVTTLMASHRWPGFNPGNIVNPNTSTPRVEHPHHELCHRTDDVAHHREPQYSTRVQHPNHELCHRTDDVTQLREPQASTRVQHPNHGLCHRTDDVTQHCESQYSP